MRSDGDVTYYKIQHSHTDEAWVSSALDHFLFKDLSRDEARGRVGDRYRELLAPQSASSDLWQRYGIHGFVEKDDGLRVLRELRALPGEQPEFRLVKRHIVQVTEAVA